MGDEEQDRNQNAPYADRKKVSPSKVNDVLAMMPK